MSKTHISMTPVTMMTGRKPVLSKEELTQMWRDKDKKIKRVENFNGS